MDNLFSHEIKNILVTGGAGFIGGTLIRKLLLSTKAKIFNLDKLNYASDLTSINLIINKERKLKDRYYFLKVDLTNESATRDAIRFSNPDLIFHLAAESHVDRSIENPKSFIFNNVIATFNLLESSRKHWENLSHLRKSSFRFHHISTDEVFGSLENSEDLFNESSPYNPRSPYSASKASSDHFVSAWNHTYGLPTLITNCSNNFGPWQFPEKLIPIIILKALKNEFIPIYGNGENIRDWLFVNDHISALLLVSANAKPGENYCIGCSQEMNNIEIALKVCSILDKLKPKNNSYKDLIKFVDDRPGHDFRYSINAKKIQKAFKWEAEFSLMDSLEITVKWYLNNLSWCENIMRNSGYLGNRLGRKI